MSKVLLQKMQKSAYQMIAMQLLVVLLSTASLALFSTLLVAYSALLGGLTSTLANSLFAKKVFSRTGASQSRYIMRAFYFGEMQKILVTGVIFIIVIKYLNVVFMPFFLMYIIAQFSCWFAPIILELNFWQKK